MLTSHPCPHAIIVAGEKGLRSSLPYGTIMLHQPRGQQAQGQASDIALKAREVLLLPRYPEP